jgi:hypothetical protein
VLYIQHGYLCSSVDVEYNKHTSCCRNEENTSANAVENALGEYKSRDCATKACSDKCTRENDATTYSNFAIAKDLDRSTDRYPDRKCQSYANGSNEGYELWEDGCW